MSPRNPALKAKDVIRRLKKLGFVEARKKGSHVILQNLSGWSTVVPVHKGEDIGKGLLRAILREANVTPEEFFELY